MSVQVRIQESKVYRQQWTSQAPPCIQLCFICAYRLQQHVDEYRTSATRSSGCVDPSDDVSQCVTSTSRLWS